MPGFLPGIFLFLLVELVDDRLYGMGWNGCLNLLVANYKFEVDCFIRMIHYNGYQCAIFVLKGGTKQGAATGCCADSFCIWPDKF